MSFTKLGSERISRVSLSESYSSDERSTAFGSPFTVIVYSSRRRAARLTRSVNCSLALVTGSVFSILQLYVILYRKSTQYINIQTAPFHSPVELFNKSSLNTRANLL